jgi:hypothetical protein
MSFVNPGDSPIDGRYYLLKYYGLEDHPAIQQTNSLNALTSLTPDQVKQLSAAIVNNTQKAEADLKRTLTDFIKQPYQESAEKILELIKENLPLMEILKIKDEVFPSLLTPLQEPTKDGILQVFHPFHKITHSYLSLGDLGIDIKISYPRDNSAPIIKLESFIPEANANLHIAYAQSETESELPLRRDFAEALNERL